MKMKPLSFFERMSGVLGINARNLLYISRYNSRMNKNFADDKLFTKNYLQSRGIGVAKVFGVIKTYNELKAFNWKSLPESFVVKPNRGYGGEGILVIKSRVNDVFIEVNNEQIKWQEIYRHIVAIMDGKYAISGLSDFAIIEERLEAHEFFKPYTNIGLPDIRIIVFNYIPVIAMLRLPTAESEGKANLHLGGVGVGIDISTGQASFAVQHNKFINKLPNGESVKNIKIPNWDEILLTASKAQHVSQIGFLAVDIVLTTTGIKILELNARAGLSVQIANQVPLRARLEKVADLKVPNPEKGVEISKTLFSSNVGIKTENKKEDIQKPVIGLFEKVDILNSKYLNIDTKIDPHFEGALFDSKLNLTEVARDNFVDIKLSGLRITLPLKTVDLSKENYKIIIGGKYLQDFLVDLNLRKPSIKVNTPYNTHTVNEKIILNIDKKISEIESKLNVIGSIRPVNIEQERNNFLKNPAVSPRFFYNKPTADILQLKKELKSLPKEIDHPLAKLFLKKIGEIKNKLEIIESIDTPKLQTISERLYGKADRVLYDQAVRYIHENPIWPDESGKLSFKAVLSSINGFLEEKKLSKWKVKIVTGRTGDVSVSKDGFINLSKEVVFSENRLRSVIMHEIETHVYRLENGHLQKYNIFEKGTANYLETEEGLAVYNQKKLGLALGEKDIWPALRVIGVYLGTEMSFVELFHYLKKNYELSDESAWRTCLKAKRGLMDTDKKIAFTRDVIYFEGYLKVKEYLDKKGENGLRDLYIGKIGLKDIPALGDLNGYKVRYLPEYK